MANINRAIAEWLAKDDPGFLAVLRQCQSDWDNGCLKLDVPPHLYIPLTRYCQKLSWLAVGQLISKIRIFVEGEERCVFAPDSPRIYQPFEGVMDLLVPQLALPLNFDNPIAIVEMGTNRGLFCTKQVARNARTTADQWLDEDMAKYHYPEELRRFVEALETHVNLREFEYRAIAFDGTPIRNVVNASLTRLGDRWVRVVETLSSEQL